MKSLNILAASAALAAVAVAAPAMAQSVSGPTYYGSVGYSNISTDDVDADLGSITGRVGARFTPDLPVNFGVEGEASFGVRGDTINVGGVNVDADAKYDAAIYGTATVPVSPNLELFARAGYGTTEIELSAAGVSDKAREESWNYGAGANYFFDGQNGVRADWTRRDFQDDAGKADVWSVGYVRRF